MLKRLGVIGFPVTVCRQKPRVRFFLLLSAFRILSSPFPDFDNIFRPLSWGYSVFLFGRASRQVRQCDCFGDPFDLTIAEHRFFVFFFFVHVGCLLLPFLLYSRRLKMSTRAYGTLSLRAILRLFVRIIKGGVLICVYISGGLARQKTAQTLFLCRGGALLRSLCFAGVTYECYKSVCIPFGYNRNICRKFAAFFCRYSSCDKTLCL